MDEFQDYRLMRESGATAQEVYRVGAKNRLDAIALIRLVRNVFGLSLKEAKEVSGAAAALNDPQEVHVGDSISWEGWTSVEGFFVMEARVRAITGDSVELEGHRRFRVTDNGLDEVPPGGTGLTRIDASYLQRPLAERLADTVRFLDFARQPPFEKKAV